MTYHSQSQDIERQQVQELSRFYSPTGSPFHAPKTPKGLENQSASRWSRLRDADSSDAALSITSDVTLNALNQLGLYRFGCTRSFTCLVLGEEKQIIAEATTSVPSFAKGRQSRDSGVGFGDDLGLRVCPSNAALVSSEDPFNVVDIIPNITSNGTRCIIRDTAQEDTSEHMLEWPHMRFYAEVPLCTPSGYVLGTYCIMDERPHAVFDDSDVGILEDVANSIANHLENVWKQLKQTRDARMMSGLSEFARGHSDTGDTKVEVRIGDDRLDRKGTTGRVLPGALQPPIILPSRKAFDTKMSLDNIHMDKSYEPNPRKASTLVSVCDVSAISQQISTLFARASSLIRECLDTEGVLFLDASRINARSSSIGTVTSEHDPGTPNTEPPTFPPQTSTSSSDGIWPNGAGRLCETLGFDVDQSSINDTSSSAFALTEGLLYDVVTAFQQGAVFDIEVNHDETPRQYVESEPELPGTSARRQLVSHMTGHFPDVKSILFLPLWDWNKSGWFAACLLWSRHSSAFGPKELDYLKAFGNSIISQVAQVDWTSKEKAKSDFISSISHELRSPLHGVLASAELLQSTRLLPAQQDMIKMVETCGITLLDTMNYLLDFAKINNLSAVNAKDKSSRSGNPDLTTTFDLDTLIEEVTNSLYAGHRYPRSFDQEAGQRRPSIVEIPRGSGTEVSAQGKMSMVTRVEGQGAWSVRSVSGAWRRITMNLIGNALKFTSGGFIEIALSKSDLAADPYHVLVHLSVTDTGSGIASDFLQNEIFTPFSQEDSLSEGVGLGLSIVQQLVTSLGGRVEVKSEVGRGTQVDVFIPVQRPSAKSPSAKPDLPGNQPRKVCLVGFNGYPTLKNASDGILSTEAKRKLAVRRSLSSIFLSQPGWTVSFSDTLRNGSGDIAVIEEDKLRQISIDGGLHTEFENLIVLGDCGTTFDRGIIKDAKVVYVTQPIGSCKVLEALKKVYASPAESHSEKQMSIRPSTSTTKRVSSGTSTPSKVSTSEWVAGSAPGQGDQTLQGSPHVLIVDDNDINLKILETFMRKIGGSYETASNGLIAVEKYQQSARRFDYVLMDISMPVMDGIDASRKIREYEQGKALQPSTIMAVTGVASASIQQRAFDAGVNDYLVKPISLHELKRIMDIKC